ncbi:RNA-dependent DNA polymerase [Ensifer sp. HO-A22]|uniref:RNA-dependent DNA polymerase n=1 Tax=Ensifer oleiphilus TaxID=2742698 RepID=A0A7Y6Q2E5_9HYPH|nr:reverse transcriptase/maturase family protein [Ensifer oleiphilus]NVD37852.1 RNA-dependent DNA polymerase [Ensifer oleiphilus]
MKSPLLKAVWKHDNIESAWRVIQENARTSQSESVRKEIADFADDSGARIRSLCNRLARGKFEFGQSTGIPLLKLDSRGQKTGKFRPLVLANVEARIVQRAVLNVLLTVPAIKNYVETPHSFGGLRRKIVADQNKRDNPTAVPAAIKEALKSVKGGAQFYVAADIRAFFTKISKPDVLAIIRSAVNDDLFVDFVEKAITTELSNMAKLSEKINDFPIYDIGVAQGNSLSPLLGNIILADFDQQMNNGDCRCIRYIDDFLVLAPTAKAANARLKKATAILDNLGMELSPEKSSKGAIPLKNGFVFLGVEVQPGIIRPSTAAQRRFLTSLESTFTESKKALFAVQDGKCLKKANSVIGTLKRVEGIIDGWGKHYWFCNDIPLFREIDRKVDTLVRDYLGAYRSTREKTSASRRRSLLGLPTLEEQDRSPFEYPRTPTASLLTPIPAK